MNLEEAERLGVKIIGRAKVYGYEGKCLVMIGPYLI